LIPFDGVPLVPQVLLTLAFVVIVAMCLWTVTLFVRGQRAIAGAPDASPGADDAWTWVFLVAALNEEITIGDSVERVLALELARRHVIVVDDGSDDATPEILARFSSPDLYVLRRDLPDARKGKAQALNAAYHCIGQGLPGVDRERVIVVVVDADGRIAPTAPRFVAAHFEDPRVGGVQALVRIYNLTGFLTQMQDVEFSVYGSVYQAGRNAAGTAGMGGNGQFNRLAALDAIVEEDGPWRSRLTEDQDLGLRLLAAGWKSRQEMRAVVEQQGVPRLRPLLRQRTRWAQGNLQALDLLGAMWRSPFPRPARAGEVLSLLMPLWQAIVGAAFVCAIVLAALGIASVIPSAEILPEVYVLGFSNSVLGCLATRHAAGRGRLRSILIAHLYAVYTWLLFPVLVRALARQIGTQREWSRTDRVPLEPVAVTDVAEGDREESRAA
jgi:cellulose synthase/poly-beta-1,6-N-acetylglucosamine synthase-like glycosyltransferase